LQRTSSRWSKFWSPRGLNLPDLSCHFQVGLSIYIAANLGQVVERHLDELG
jgi:hypothetical protein